MAVFADTYQEANGVATLCRALADYARAREIPLLCVHGGGETSFTTAGSVQELQLKRGFLSFPLDAHMKCDPALTRHRNRAVRQLLEFRPHLVHITGPGDVGILGFWASNRAGVPMMASWHTNLHEYAARRLQQKLRLLPRPARERIAASAGDRVLWAVTKFYRLAHFLAAPNQEMSDYLEARTERPAFYMQHGVDTARFSPARRTRRDGQFVIGYVGRLTPEKNVRVLAELEANLLAAGERDFRFLIVGEGSEAGWLRAHLRHAEFTGILRGVALAEAFANMDAFVFPSRTDTFGLVVLEALASGVPVITTPVTGERVGLVDGIHGFVTEDWAGSVRRLMQCGETRARMSAAAREWACAWDWSGVFDNLYGLYARGLRAEATLRRMPTPKFQPVE